MMLITCRWSGGGGRKSYHDTRSCRCNEEGIDAIKVGGRESRKNTIFSEIGSLMLYDIENMQVEGGGGQESRKTNTSTKDRSVIV